MPSKSLPLFSILVGITQPVFFQFICVSSPHTGLETSTGWFPGVLHGTWYTFQYQISVLANSRQIHECTHKGNECFFSWCVFTGDRYPSDRGLWGKVFLWALYKPTTLQRPIYVAHVPIHLWAPWEEEPSSICLWNPTWGADTQYLKSLQKVYFLRVDCLQNANAEILNHSLALPGHSEYLGKY